MAFKMKGSPFHNMESNAQQRKNLMSDDPIGSQASALNKMDPMHNGKPGVQKEDFEQFSSPMNQRRKVKKAAKTQAQIDKIRKSFGTKDADVSGRFERKRKKMDKTVGQLEKKGVKVDFDTTSAEGEGSSRKTTKKTSYVKVPIAIKKVVKPKFKKETEATPPESAKKQFFEQTQKLQTPQQLPRVMPTTKKQKVSPMNQGRKVKKARKTLKQIEEMQDKRQTKIRVNSKVSRIVDEGVISNKEKRKSRKLAKTMKQVKDSSPMNQGKITDRPGIKGKKKISKIQIAKTESSKPQQSSNPSNIKGQQKSKFGIGVSKLKSQVKKKKSPLDNKENRAEVKAAKEGKSGKEKRQAAKAVRKQQRSEGKRGVKKTVTQVKKVVDKVKDSKVYKVGKGIADTVANVKSGRIGAAIESGKKTIADAKKKKSDSPATMKKSPLYQAKTMGKPPKAKTLTKSMVVPKQKEKIQMKVKQELGKALPRQRFQNLKNLPKAVEPVYKAVPVKKKKVKTVSEFK